MPGRKKEKGSAAETVKGLASFFVPYWILTFVVIFIIFAVVALIFMTTSLSQKTFPFISCFVFVAVELVISYMMGKFCSIPAVLTGGIYGAGIAIITLIIGILTGGVHLFSLKFLCMLITGIMLGIFGAIAGYNSKPRRKYGRFSVK